MRGHGTRRLLPSSTIRKRFHNISTVYCMLITVYFSDSTDYRLPTTTDPYFNGGATSRINAPCSSLSAKMAKRPTGCCSGVLTEA